MTKPMQEKLLAHLAALAEQAGITAERIEELQARYQRWVERFRANRVFAELHARVSRAWDFLKDPAVPAKKKAIVAAAVLYVIAPIDLVPDVLPLVGLLDDLAAMAIAMSVIDGHESAKAEQPDTPPSEGENEAPAAE